MINVGVFRVKNIEYLRKNLDKRALVVGINRFGEILCGDVVSDNGHHVDSMVEIVNIFVPGEEDFNQYLDDFDYPDYVAKQISKYGVVIIFSTYPKVDYVATLPEEVSESQFKCMENIFNSKHGIEFAHGLREYYKDTSFMLDYLKDYVNPDSKFLSSGRKL